MSLGEMGLHSLLLINTIKPFELMSLKSLTDYIPGVREEEGGSNRPGVREELGPKVGRIDLDRIGTGPN